MKFTEEQKASLRRQFREMGPAEKLDYIITYYKWHILFLILAAAILAGTVIGRVRKRTPVLYIGEINAAWGEDLEKELTSDYLKSADRDPRREEVYVYSALYISDDPEAENHEYAYASQLKLMGAINAGSLDVVLMNGEAYDILSQSGSLLELPDLLSRNDTALFRSAEPYLAENTVILYDNSIDVSLGNAAEAEQKTAGSVNGLLLNDMPRFCSSGLDGPVYLGVIANSTREDEIVSYIRYLLS